MFCCSAAGDLLPTIAVFKSQSGYLYDTWGAGALPGSIFSANKSGWFNMHEYEVWFEKVFLVWLTKNLPKEDIKVLISDNLGALVSHRVMELCTENNIRYLVATNLAQYRYCVILCILTSTDRKFYFV